MRDVLLPMQSPPDWQEILQNFRGSELQNYFTRILEDDLTATVKPQYVDNIPKAIRSAVKTLPSSSLLFLCLLRFCLSHPASLHTWHHGAYEQGC